MKKLYLFLLCAIAILTIQKNYAFTDIERLQLEAFRKQDAVQDQRERLYYELLKKEAASKAGLTLEEYERKKRLAELSGYFTAADLVMISYSIERFKKNYYSAQEKKENILKHHFSIPKRKNDQFLEMIFGCMCTLQIFCIGEYHMFPEKQNAAIALPLSLLIFGPCGAVGSLISMSLTMLLKNADSSAK